MKLDAVSVPNANAPGKPNAPAPAREAAAALSEGDVVRARVVSSRDGGVTLRTAEGMLFNARLEEGVELPQGAFARLVVTQAAGETIVMSLAVPEWARGTPPQPDTASRAMAAALRAMGAAPAGELLEAMRAILSANPDIPLPEAAFMAANRLPAEHSVMEAVHRLFTGESDTARLLLSLESLAAQASAGSPGPPAQDGVPQTPVNGPETQALAAATAEAAAPEAAQAQAQAEGSAGNVPEQAGAAPGPQAFTQWLAKALGVDARVFTNAALSASPLLEGLSSKSLAGIAGSLRSIAASMPELQNERELFGSIARFARTLFLEKDAAAGRTASVLKGVRDELYVKLAYFKDAAAASSAPSRDMVLRETEKLMEHVKLLNSLDRFAYIQVPLHESAGGRNAELYIYKNNKGARGRIDPENVKILLALDLEHMGHLEAFIEVRGREVALRCEAANEEIVSVFRQDTTKLYKMLDAIGYKFTNFSAGIRKSVTTVETSLLALLDYERKRGAGVDYRV